MFRERWKSTLTLLAVLLCGGADMALVWMFGMSLQTGSVIMGSLVIFRLVVRKLDTLA
jgi:hypothetical protein